MEAVWENIRDCCPSEGQRIIAVDKWQPEINIGYWLSDENGLCESNVVGGGNWKKAFTYWMPLPELPKPTQAPRAQGVAV